MMEETLDYISLINRWKQKMSLSHIVPLWQFINIINRSQQTQTPRMRFSRLFSKKGQYVSGLSFSEECVFVGLVDLRQNQLPFLKVQFQGDENVSTGEQAKGDTALWISESISASSIGSHSCIFNHPQTLVSIQSPQINTANADIHFLYMPNMAELDSSHKSNLDFANICENLYTLIRILSSAVVYDFSSKYIRYDYEQRPYRAGSELCSFKSRYSKNPAIDKFYQQLTKSQISKAQFEPRLLVALKNETPVVGRFSDIYSVQLKDAHTLSSARMEINSNKIWGSQVVDQIQVKYKEDFSEKVCLQELCSNIFGKLEPEKDSKLHKESKTVNLNYLMNLIKSENLSKQSIDESILEYSVMSQFYGELLHQQQRQLNTEVYHSCEYIFFANQTKGLSQIPKIQTIKALEQLLRNHFKKSTEDSPAWTMLGSVYRKINIKISTCKMKNSFALMEEYFLSNVLNEKQVKQILQQLSSQLKNSSARIALSKGHEDAQSLKMLYDQLMPCLAQKLRKVSSDNGFDSQEISGVISQILRKYENATLQQIVTDYHYFANTLKEELGNQIEKNHQQQQEIFSQKQKIEGLSKRLKGFEDLKESYCNIQAKLFSQRRDVLTLNNSVSQKNSQIQRLQHALQSLNNELQKVKNEKGYFLEAISQLSKQNQHYISKLESSSQELQKAHKKLQSYRFLENQLIKKTEDIGNLKYQNELLERHLAEAKQGMQLWKQKQVQKVNFILKSNYQQHLKIVAEKEVEKKQFAELLASVNSLKNENTRLKAELQFCMKVQAGFANTESSANHLQIDAENAFSLTPVNV